MIKYAYSVLIDGVLLNDPSPIYDNKLLFKCSFCNFLKFARSFFSMLCNLLWDKSLKERIKKCTLVIIKLGLFCTC